MEPLNLEGKSDLIFLGGGPTTLGFFITAIRQGRIYELAHTNMLILEKGEIFGVDNLEKQIIYSNYPAVEILRIILKEPACNDQNFYSQCYIESEQIELKQHKIDESFFTPNTKKKSFSYLKEQTQSISQYASPISYSGNSNHKNGKQNNSKSPIINNQKPAIKISKVLDQQKLNVVIRQNCMTLLQEILTSSAYKDLVQYGLGYPPIALVGYFLRLCGYIILRYIKTITNKTIFKPLLQATALGLTNEGYINIRCKLQKPENNTQQNPAASDSYKLVNGGEDDYMLKQNRTQANIFKPKVMESYKTYQTKNLIMSKGCIDQEPQLEALKNFSSDNHISANKFINDDYYAQALQTINMLQQGQNNILIFGKKLKSFQAAYILLNGPGIYLQRDSDSDLSKKARQTWCGQCCQCSLKNQYATQHATSTLLLSRTKIISTSQSKITPLFGEERRSSNKKNSKLNNIYSKIFENNNNKSEENEVITCKCDCKCYGSIKQMAIKWKKQSVFMPKFNEGQIILAYKGDIKIINQIDKCSSKSFEQLQFLNQSSLRGLEKQLYLDIIKGVEKRIKLVRYKNEEELNNLILQSNFVISSFKQVGHIIPIKDHVGQNLQMIKNKNKQIFDSQNRLMSSKGSLKSVYGFGPGFCHKSGNNYLHLIETEIVQKASLFPINLMKIGHNCLNSILQNISQFNRQSDDHQLIWFDQEDQLEKQQNSLQNNIQNIEIQMAKRKLIEADFTSYRSYFNNEILDENTTCLDNITYQLDKQLINFSQVDKLMYNRKNKQNNNANKLPNQNIHNNINKDYQQ